MPLPIKSREKTQLDLVSLGECLIRLSPPGHSRLEFTNHLEVHVAGTEYNVAYALARLGLRTAFASRLVDNPLGAIVLNHARAAGIDLRHVALAPYDGVGNADRIGLNFAEVGTGVRPSTCLYDHGHSAAMHIQPGDVDFDVLFAARGVRWFHTSAAFTALSDSTAEVVTEALVKAKTSGAITSYDLNLCSQLPSPDKARSLTTNLLNFVDCLIGSEDDFQNTLGIQVENASDEPPGSPDAAAYKRLVEKVIAQYPNLRVVASTCRTARNNPVNNGPALLWHDGQFFESRTYPNLEIEDPAGSDDAFTAGVIYAFLHGMSPQAAVDLGAAHAALLQSTRGATSQTILEELIHLFQTGNIR